MRTQISVALIAAIVAGSAFAQEPTSLVTTSVSDYSLRPGDVLVINVWGQEAFSGQFQIDENERFLYPVLGEISTSDLNIAQVRDTLIAGLETLFNNPFVTVSPRFRVSVLGHVSLPGLYTIDPTLTAIDVVAMATHGTGGERRALEDSVTANVLRHSNRPLLVWSSDPQCRSSLHS